MFPNDFSSSSGFPGALPHPRPHHAIPAAEWQRAPVDSGERGAGDIVSASGSCLLHEAPRLLSAGHSDAAPLPAARGGVHRPKEPQVCDEAAVRDLGVKSGVSFFLSHTVHSLCSLWLEFTSVAGHVEAAWSSETHWFCLWCKNNTRRGCEPSFTDALLSNCDQLYDCPNPDRTDAFTLFLFMSLQHMSQRKTLFWGGLFVFLL